MRLTLTVMKPSLKCSLFLIIFLAFNGCQSPEEFQREKGVVSAFAELVNAGVKEMAFSGTMSSSDMDVFFALAVEEAAKYNVEIYRESALIVTDLFPEDVALNQEVLILYQGQTKAAYLKLKADRQALLSDNKYEGAARREIARRLGRMLSYTPRAINKLLSEQTEFRVMSDFGVEATNVFLYYKDLEKATKFYTETLGLKLLAEYDNASVIGITQTSIIILVDAAKGMHSADEPKSVAIALLTNQLPEWYAYVQAQNISIKYSYKPKEGGPHDGFVAIDPEGYLLEFELFKEHEENEAFTPILAASKDVLTSITHNGKALGFNASITWLYYQGMQNMQNFYEDVVGLEMVVDQGWAKVYQGSSSGFIGLVDEKRGMNKYADTKAVNVSFLIEDLDGWYEYVQTQKPFELRGEEIGEGPEVKYRAFVGYDPEKYFMEFDKFYEHKDNVTLMQFLKNE